MKARRRGQNEGSIFKRSDGRWCGIVSLGWRDGRRVRKSFYGTTACDVQGQMAKAKNDLALGLPVLVERQTVKQFFDSWLENSVKPSVRPATYQQYHQHCRIYLGPALGHHRLARLAPQHVQAFVNEKLKDGLSPRTVRLSLVILRHALDTAVKWNLAGRNVAKLVDSPRVEHHEIQPLDPGQARSFLDAAKGARLEALFVTALSLGLRQGEALGLRWADVNLDDHQLSIKQSLQRIGGRRFGSASALQLVEPKTERSRRTLRLPEAVVRALRTHRVRQLEERLAAGPRWNESGLVFSTAIGTPLDPQSAVSQFKAVLSKAGLSSATRFHDLRHSAASLLLAQGVPMRAVMELLGHSSIGLTANTYSHVMPAMMRDMADKMDAILDRRTVSSRSVAVNPGCQIVPPPASPA